MRLGVSRTRHTMDFAEIGGTVVVSCVILPLLEYHLTFQKPYTNAWMWMNPSGWEKHIKGPCRQGLVPRPSILDENFIVRKAC